MYYIADSDFAIYFEGDYEECQKELENGKEIYAQLHVFIIKKEDYL